MELDPLLQPVAPVAGGPDEPCGPDLKGTFEFAELQRLAQGKPEQYLGDKIVAAAEEPPWREVIKQAGALLAKSKDLRIAVILTRGLLATEGWTGFAEGLGFIRRMLEIFWQHVHPQLDREDGDDPTLRMNSLAELAHEETILGPLRRQILVTAPRAGRFSLRDVVLAAGTAAGAAVAGNRPSPALIAAAFLEADVDQLRRTAAAVHAARDNAAAIEAVATEKLLTGRPVSLAELTKLLQDADRLVAERVGPRLRESAADGEGGRSMGEVGAGSGARVESASAASAPGLIQSREDVVRALDAVCGYYRAHEPSSPLPILLERAKSLVSKSFFEIVKDLVPGGVDQLEIIRGKQGEGKSD